MPMRPGLAPYAARAGTGQRRMVPEPEAADRSPFQRDRDRILHSIAFRRLALKTQVLLPEAGDHHRTRLTHTLEVAQIARSLARSLRLDEDLTEALALAHDLGHGPFGHTGEDALDKVLRPWGGFDHNVQSLRIVVDVEQRYLDFDGLNLTWDMLDGLAKRNGPCTDPPALLLDYAARLCLDLRQFPCGEAQVAALADDIAYNAHDLEDGLRAGFFTIDDIDDVPVIHDLLHRLRATHGALNPVRLPFALTRGIIDLFVTDALAETRRRLVAHPPADAEAVRCSTAPVIALSPPMRQAASTLSDFLFAHLYRHPRLVPTRQQAHDLVAALAERFMHCPDLLPQAWSAQAVTGICDLAGRARLVSDYVAGMTDRHAIREYRRLFDASPDFV